jgi:hypothetical protein
MHKRFAKELADFDIDSEVYHIPGFTFFPYAKNNYKKESVKKKGHE